MRLALTGGSGFIGRHVLDAACAAGHEVHVIGRRAPDRDDVVFHRCDLGDRAAMRAALAAARPQVLVHMAWYAEHGRFWAAPENLDWVAASLDLARAFAECGGERLVVAGSCAEYDWSHSLLDEAVTPLAAGTLYGRAKASLFQVLMAAAPVLGLSIGWGRIFFPYGPGDRPERLIGTLIAALRGEREARFSAGTQARDFIHAADAGRAMVALAGSDLTGAVNVASGIAISVRELVELCAAQCANAVTLHFAAPDPLSTEPPLLVASTRRLHDELGFVPQFDYRTGLRDTLTSAGLPLRP